MNQKWVLRSDHSPETIENLATELNVSPLIAQILLNRGIHNFETARIFFRADIEDLYDPFLFQQMKKAVDRIVTALEKQETVMIYGDYDVDGITSVSLMLRVFRDELNFQPIFYIPNRMTEGYGISNTGIEAAKKAGVSLIISVDCGITAHEQVELAQQVNIDMIISDHHESGATLPQAFAIIDPKCESETYPFTELAGVGVAYKLLQGLFQRLGRDPGELKKYIEFVALGSAADIVPLIDENRIFVRVGLNEMPNSQNIGLKALIEATGLQAKYLGTGQIVFIIAPRINAVGRLGDAARAVKLLTTNNPQQAKNIAAILEAENRNRKSIDEQTFAEAQKIIETEYPAEKNHAFVLAQEDWHSGVIGIVASRVVEKYYRPTILISVENGIGKGSARSIQGFDVYQALQECSDLLSGFGGHKYAAGLSIEAEKIPAFRQRFDEVAASWLDEDALTPKLRIEGEIRLSQINAKFYRILKQFAPFGPQNMRPIFVAKNLETVGSPAIVGKNHLKIKVRQDGVIMDAIGFNLGHLIYRLEPGEKNLNLAFVIDENEWLGTRTIQLRIKDLI